MKVINYLSYIRTLDLIHYLLLRYPTGFWEGIPGIQQYKEEWICPIYHKSSSYNSSMQEGSELCLYKLKSHFLPWHTLASLLMPCSVSPTCREINGEPKSSCLNQPSHRQGLAKFTPRCHLVSHSKWGWLSWTNPVPMMGKSSSTANWSHSSLCWRGQEPALQRGGKGIKSQTHLGQPTSNNLEKPGKSPRTLQKERQVSKRVKQRATNLFTYNVSKGGTSKWNKSFTQP